MGDRLLDPYEEQLLAVFDSCDEERKGSLDRQGLLLLCDKLQLEEQGGELMECLLDGATDRVTFVVFRDGLLALLDRGQGDNEPHGTDLGVKEELPEREVSPKFVFGKKKYGRRTRPKNADLNSSENNDDSDLDTSISNDISSINSKPEQKADKAVIDSGQHPKKRKKSENRPITICGEHDISDEVFPRTMTLTDCSSALKLTSSDCEVECLRNTWDRLGVGSDGYLDRTELALVCDHIGMEKVAEEVVKEVFDTLDVDRDNRISFEEFLLLFRSGGRTSQPQINMGRHTVEKLPHFESRLTPNSGESQSLSCAADNTYFWSLDLNGNGFVSADLILEVWENSGVPEGLSLLHHLGFTESQVKLAELVSVLENELNVIQAESDGTGITTPSETLLQATLALSQTQVRCIKSSLEQVCSERDKLRFDIAEANDRASLLAQEVDDHHSRLENSNKAQIKSLEQRHGEQLKHLTDQLTHERDHLAHQNHSLECRVWELEELETQSRTQVTALKEDNAVLEKENQSLVEQLAAMETECVVARKELETLDGLRQGMREMELNNDNEKILVLLEKLEDSQRENTELRDRNDELTMKVEVLTSELSATKVKKAQQGEDVLDKIIVEQECTVDELSVAGGAIKRRGDPPLCMSMCEESSEEESSPRLEKVRRCCSSSESRPSDVQVSVGALMDPCCKMSYSTDENQSLSLGHSVFLNQSQCSNETTLQAQIENIEQQSKAMQEKPVVSDAERNLHLSEYPVQMELFSSPQLTIQTTQITEAEHNTKDLSDCGNTKEQLEQHCRDLKSQLDKVKIEIVKILSERNACSKENCALKTHISDLKNSLGQPIYHNPFSCAEIESLESVKNGSGDFVALTSTSEPTLQLKPAREDNVLESEFILSLQSEFADQLSIIQENHMKEKIELLERCTNLESSIEMLRQEYEKCEDYWASKLEEERVLYDKEQRVLDKKYKKILAELKEYDEYRYFPEDRSNNSRRLDTIEESETLESQVTVLEEECEELRKQLLTEREEWAQQYQILNEKLHEQESSSANSKSFGTSLNNQRQHAPLEIQLTEEMQAALLCSNLLSTTKHKGLSQTELNRVLNVAIQVPEDDDALMEILDVHDHLPLETDVPHRQKEHSAYCIRDDKNSKYVGGGGMNCGRQACRVDLNVLQTMNVRWRKQEQRCRHLQLALKQRQRHTDLLLQHSWTQHKKEISELKHILGTTQKNLHQQTLAYKEQLDRMSRNDVLVKDLYVENAYLVSTVQRLEQHCQVLAHMTTDSISV